MKHKCIGVSFNEVSRVFFNVSCFNGTPGTNYTVIVTADHSRIFFSVTSNSLLLSEDLDENDF